MTNQSQATPSIDYSLIRQKLTHTRTQWVEAQSELPLSVNSWKVSSHIVKYDTNPPAIQKHSQEAQIELPFIEWEWAFRIRAIDNLTYLSNC
jgi:hypothetical protein